MKPFVLVLAVALCGVVFSVPIEAQQVQGLGPIMTSGQTSDQAPAIAALRGRIYVAWKGSNNTQLNVMFSTDGGRSFRGAFTSRQQSDSAPSLVAYRGKLFIAWRGVPNNLLNVAEVDLNAAGAPTDLVSVWTSPQEISPSTPNLAATEDGLFITWRGMGNDQLNVAPVLMN